MVKSVPISAVYAGPEKLFWRAALEITNGIAPHRKLLQTLEESEMTEYLAMSSGVIISTFALLVTFCAQELRGPFRPHGSAMSRSR
jgi:hypothetical protein